MLVSPKIDNAVMAEPVVPMKFLLPPVRRPPSLAEPVVPAFDAQVAAPEHGVGKGSELGGGSDVYEFIKFPRQPAP